MPKETYPTDDSVEAIVERSGVSLGPGHDPDSGVHHHVASEVLGDWTGNTIRDINDDSHVLQDIEHLRLGILDPKSFVEGYTQHDHPVEYLVHGADGNLKQRVHSHNIRTNLGGAWQAILMGGDVPGMIAYTGSYTASSATTLTTSGFPTTMPPTGYPTAAMGWPQNPFVGHLVIVGNVFGVITATNITTITVDKWHIPASGAMSQFSVGVADGPGATPGGSGTYLITPGLSPTLWLGLSSLGTTSYLGDYVGWNASSSPSGITDWTSAELTATSGLGRAATSGSLFTANYGPYMAAMSFNSLPNGGLGVATPSATGIFKVTQVFTCQAPQTVWKSGLFNTGVAQTGLLIFEANLSTQASLSSGDTLTVTWQIQY